MDDFSLHLLFSVAATFFIAGIVKGVTGMGLPTVAMGILGGFLSPLTAASLLIIPSFVTNLWQLLAGPSLLGIVRQLWLMMVGIFIGTVVSASMLMSGNTAMSTFALGAALTIYAVFTLLAKPRRINPSHQGWLSPIVGIVTGLITGATGVFVIPAVPYLQALGFEKDDLVQALGLSFTVSTIALAVGLFSRGAFQLDGVGLSAFAMLPALAGMWAGQYIRKIASPTIFKRGFLIALAILGVEMISRNFW